MLHFFNFSGERIKNWKFPTIINKVRDSLLNKLTEMHVTAGFALKTTSSTSTKM